MNHLTLKATRKALGLEVADACQLMPSPKTGETLNKRTFQYFESGKFPVPPDVELKFFNYASHYHLLLAKLTADIQAFKVVNPYPKTDNSDEYFAQLKSVKKLVLPYFADFEQFTTDTGNKSVGYWRIWQAVLGHLVLVGTITQLDDNATIPKDFSVWAWLNGDYK